ncbi:UL5 DNA helicase-primase associated protein [Meleagrid alphaherpesvirus 1]|uniref:UL5 DNA helicase-primase associated protein n=1 Tax=Meleagrid herpesvirus 1 TaxID=37108 RepID=Q9DPS9_MEHV1|nr:helicase-primase helicase subunit [Meleagrid alphaherpesvirus 1]AKQ48590.1 helicase-primase helicase subunit [iBAC vector pMeHV1-C7]AKQ48662.1 helicase-primase helicase subunit [iBAC vector pMeHV1-C9]AKQ48734.1 helicase-primase helicase subunit [iBAC vector pMeHV1-C10]AKQ48806.1 helicase-primase helicase subunit [iBAC vector pMeHV1-C17]AKQ48878.1 helicase-primase helicase subunit [iBAC vector pMeHV1-C18]
MARSSTDRFDESMYLNFTAMHGIHSIISRVRVLANATLPYGLIPPLSYFIEASNVEDPSTLSLRDLPFSTYLISGNAGSGKSTCIQTLSEIMDCIITGTTKVASQNIYGKLSNSYTSSHINTIFQEFGFKGHHVQATLGKWQYACTSNPPTIKELQKRDLVYYWEVLSDITKCTLKLLETDAGPRKFDMVYMLEEVLGRDRGSLAWTAFGVNGSLPSFTRSNIIIIDEAGLIGKHLLTAIVYCWWLINATYRTPQYIKGRRPVLVCVGSPTQTSSLETTFEHSKLRCNVRTSENILTYIICNPTLRSYLDLSKNWSIFINNKRCTEPEFGDLLKVLEYGLPITEEHARIVDSFVVPESYINNPANLPGWTRLYSSHKEVSAYMSRLHDYLKTSGDNMFVVFTLPAYTFINLEAFEKYCTAANQTSITIEKWLVANASRLSNWSQSRDQDSTRSKCEIRSQLGLAISCSDITYVLNSQVAVTTRLRKWVFGFCGTFESFLSVLKDDSFIKTHGEGSIEYAYRFLSQLLFNGMINFYNYLQQRGLQENVVKVAYERLATLTTTILFPGGQTQTHDITDVHESAILTGINCREYSQSAPAPFESHWGEADDVIFSALDGQMIDLLYCNYEFARLESSSEIYAQFSMLKNIFTGRYAIMTDLFGDKFSKHRFDSYVDNVSTKGCQIFINNMRGGMSSLALQTDSYTLMGYTYARVNAFADEPIRRKIDTCVAEVLCELNMPTVVLKDQHGFMAALNSNITDFVEMVDENELKMAVTADYGISSKLAMTIARSQGLSLERAAICFPQSGLKLSSVYVAMSRVTSSKFLRMNINPLRETHTRDDNNISEHLLAALRDPNVHIVY